MASKCMRATQPEYLTDSLQRVADLPGRQCLRSASSTDLAVPQTRLSEQSFRVAAAKTWNSLLSEVTSSATLSTFKHKLKTRLFNCHFLACNISPFYPTTHTVVQWLQCSAFVHFKFLMLDVTYRNKEQKWQCINMSPVVVVGVDWDCKPAGDGYAGGRCVRCRRRGQDLAGWFPWSRHQGCRQNSEYFSICLFVIVIVVCIRVLIVSCCLFFWNAGRKTIRED